jgi:hypothetical protein
MDPWLEVARRSGDRLAAVPRFEATVAKMDNPGFTAFDHPINQVEIPPGWQNPHSLLAGKPTALREMPDQIDVASRDRLTLRAPCRFWWLR